MTTSSPLLSKSPEDLIDWAESQSWVEDLCRTTQDHRWHAEGDVWTHTRQVCDRLMSLSEWNHMADPEKTILLLAALFHDIGKGVTTEERADSITAPNHAPVGRRLTVQRLIREPIDYRHRELTASLVRFHSTPPTIGKRKDPQRTVIDVSWFTRANLLHLLALADALGRDSEEESDFLENIEQFREICLNLDCFEQSYPFANDQARFLWFRNALEKPDDAPDEDFRCEVTMLSGLPGAGKDHWYQHHANHLPMMSLDGIRRERGISWSDDQGPVIAEAERRFIEFLDDGTSFVYNATNIDRDMRRKWIRLARKRKARIRIVYIEPPLEVIRRQNRQREAVVEDEVIDAYVERLEVPYPTEAHEVVWV